MDQCSRHDIPSVLSATLTNQPGHGLCAEIDSPNVQVLTGRRLGHHHRRNPTTGGGYPLERALDNPIASRQPPGRAASRPRCGVTKSRSQTFDQRSAGLSVRSLEWLGSAISAQMLSWISMNCLALAWHSVQMTTSPASLNEPRSRTRWQTTQIVEVRGTATSSHLPLEPTVRDSTSGRARQVRSSELRIGVVAAFGEPGACSTQASIVAEPVPARVLALVSTEFGVEPSECAGPAKRVGET